LNNPTYHLGAPVPDAEVRAISSGVKSVYDSWLQPIQQPACLYHYTTPAGLHGILTSKVIRASHLAYMNDYSEYLHAGKLLLKEVVAELEKKPAESARAMLEYLKENIESTSHDNMPPIYVACFSACKNDLGQWRAYGRGTGGFCLGFPSGLLAQAAAQQGLLIHKVNYDEQEQAELCRRILAWACKRVDELGSAIGQEDERLRHARDWGKTFVSALVPLAPLFKHRSFKEEQEWRITKLAFDPRLWKVDCAGDSLRMYIELKLDAHIQKPNGIFIRLPVSELWIGPGPYGNISQMAAKHLLEQNAFYDVALEQAWIPYRGR
jgi:hypothetical protein